MRKPKVTKQDVIYFVEQFTEEREIFEEKGVLKVGKKLTKQEIDRLKTEMDKMSKLIGSIGYTDINGELLGLRINPNKEHKLSDDIEKHIYLHILYYITRHHSKTSIVNEIYREVKNDILFYR